MSSFCSNESPSIHTHTHTYIYIYTDTLKMIRYSDANITRLLWANKNSTRHVFLHWENWWKITQKAACDYVIKHQCEAMMQYFIKNPVTSKKHYIKTIWKKLNILHHILRIGSNIWFEIVKIKIISGSQKWFLWEERRKRNYE